MDLESIRNFKAAFDPLKPELAMEGNLYVDLSSQRGGSNWTNQLVNTITTSPGRTCQALTGHRGCGKTTELLRVKKQLEDLEHFVVMCNLCDEIEPNDVDFPEVLLAIVRNIASECRKLGIELNPGFLEARWQQVKSLLGTISLDGLDIETGIATIKTSIKVNERLRAWRRVLVSIAELSS